jgi:predicted aminopeptidase
VNPRKLLLMAGLGSLGAMLLAAATVCLTSGCSSLGYYAQSVTGHLGVLQASRPVQDWLDDSQTPPALRARLALSQRMRDFAVSELALPDNASYRRYADLKRPAAVWNVVAAPELSLQLKTWCFPVVGCVGYRGYFDRTAADAQAAELRAQGFEVTVYGVPAYSTLGTLPGNWFADPLLNTFINYTEGELARLIFHELSHQVAYAQDDTMFNESYATAVERLGGTRWLGQPGQAQALLDYQQYDGRRQDFRALTQRVRDQLAAIYASTAGEAQKRRDKQAVLATLQADYQVLKTERWGGYSGYDAWIGRANNASFGVLAAYNELVPQFERLFDRQGRDFARFHAEVKRLAALPKAERRAQLAHTGD